MNIGQWKELGYLDPEPILVGLHELATSLPLQEAPYRIASLRTRELRRYGELRQCALFCYLIGKAMNLKVGFSAVESSDYDCIAHFQSDGIVNFVPIQLKEFVPEQVNPNTSLQELINSLSKYTDSKDLTVAVHLNRAGTINLSELVFPNLNIGELWFFGANSSDQGTWTLIGNLLKPGARFYEFQYPRA